MSMDGIKDFNEKGKVGAFPFSHLETMNGIKGLHNDYFLSLSLSM